MVGGNGESSYAANSMFQVPSILSFLIPYLSLSGTQNWMQLSKNNSDLMKNMLDNLRPSSSSESLNIN
jgi:hypothetical protein